MRADERSTKRSHREIWLAAFTLALAGAVALVCHILIVTDPYKEWTPPERSRLLGDGTQSDPYLIGSLEDLYVLQARVDYGNDFAGKYFVQTRDIDMSACENWTPIGEYGSDKCFAGTYDGMGHVLENLNISGTGRNALFRMLTGTVRNLGIESGSIEGSYAGSIAAAGSETAEIQNCYNKASVHGRRRAGGIADDFGGSITNCWNFGQITSETGAVGGICCLGAQVYRCNSSGLPVVANTYLGLNDSQVFTSLGELSVAEGTDENLSPLLIVDGETVRFEAAGHEYAQEERGIRYDFFGKGTEDDPYLITSLEDLSRFRDLVNEGHSFANTYFAQTQDIDMSPCENWTAIGVFDSGNYFCGTYDGNGHVLENLTITGDGNNSLFGMLCGTVQNLGIESGYIEGAFVGSITSHGDQNAKIINCYNKATVHGFGRAGGIADNLSIGSISHCWNLGEVTCDSGTVGGICSYTAQIDHCYSRGLPLMPPELFGVGDSHAIRDAGSIDMYLAAIYAGVDPAQTPLMYREGESVRFDVQPYKPWMGGEYGFAGSGREGDPYLITSLEDLSELRDLVNAGNDFAGAYFLQTRNIDMSPCENWTSIGVFGSEHYFRGIYDGNGHVLSNLTIVGTDNNSLFGVLCGTVQNLGIESGYIEGAFVGSITSHGDQNAKIVNCYNKASVHGFGRAGGIADNFAGTISYCWNFGAVTCDAGVIGGISSYCAQIDHCYSYGLPATPAEFYGTLTDSEAFDEAEGIDRLLTKALAGMYTDLAQKGQEPVMVWSDGTIRFVGHADWELSAPDELGFSGKGTADDPYLITGLEDLSRFRDLVNQGNGFEGTYFLQTQDIDMSPGGNWTPIGEYNSDHYFHGIYDGNGYVLLNLTIIGESNNSFFGVLCGTVQNLGIESGYIEGSYVGSFTSHGDQNAKIINCYNKATVHGAGRAGGIADNLGGMISNCWNLGQVISDIGVTGGIASYAATVDHCYSFGMPAVSSAFLGKAKAAQIISKEEKAAEILNELAAERYEAAADEQRLPTMVSDGSRLWFDGDRHKVSETMTLDLSGSGTEKDPYLVTCLDDLVEIRDLVNAGTGFDGCHFLQTQDIDMSACRNWMTIGVLDSRKYFFGDYNGNGHTLQNLTVIERGNAGLFGYLCGTVRNLGIESGYIEGPFVGAITSHGGNKALIYNCYNKADVYGFGRAAGIADNIEDGTIEYCWNLGRVKCATSTYAGICSLSAGVRHCYSKELPVVSAPNVYLGTVEDSETVISTEEIQKALEDVYASMYADGVDAETVPFIVLDGDTIRFDPGFTPACYTRKILADHSSMILLLIVSAAAVVFVIIYLRGKGSASHHRPEGGPTGTDKGGKPTKAMCGTALFLAILCGGGVIMNDTLYLKSDNGTLPIYHYFQQPADSVDVLLMGSSKVGINMSIDTLWREQGISSFALWGHTQPAWNSYFYLKEVLRSRRPKVIVFDISAASWERTYRDNGVQYANNQGLSLSLDKLEEIQASAPQDRWMDLLLEFPLYHERYAELTQTDFSWYPWSEKDEADKGSIMLYSFGNVSVDLDVSDIKTVDIIPEKEKKYLLRFLALCEEENIPLVLCASDSAKRETLQPYFNAIAEIAEEWDIPFINFNLLDEETGFTLADFCQDNNHINTNGSRKLSSYLGDYLKEHYDLEDHRGDPDYSSWDEFAFRQENAHFLEITRMSDYLKEMLRDDREAVMVRWALKDDNANLEALRQTADETEMNMSFLEEPGDRCWVFRHTPDMTEYESVALDGAVDIPLGEGTLTIDPYSERALSFDGKKVCDTQTGLMCVIYDTNTGAIVDKCMLAEPSGAAGTVRHI